MEMTLGAKAWALFDRHEWLVARFRDQARQCARAVERLDGDSPYEAEIWLDLLREFVLQDKVERDRVGLGGA